MPNLENKNKQSFFRVNKTAFVFSGLFLIIALGFTYTLNIFLERQENQRFVDQSFDLVDSLEEEFSDYIQTLFSIKAFFKSSTNVDRSEFAVFVNSQDILQKFPAIQAVEFISFVKNEDRDSFVENVKLDGFPDFSINPEFSTDDYYVVNYIVPFVGNEEAFGFDLGSNSSRLYAIDKSIVEDDVAITEPIKLVQNGHDAFLAFIPIYKNGEPTQTVRQRESALLGLAALVIDLDVFFHDSFLSLEKAQGLSIRASDISFDSEPVFFENIDNDYSNFFSNLINLEVGFREWSFFVQENEGFFEKESQINIIKILSIFGAVITSMFVFFIVHFLIKDRLKTKNQSILLKNKVKEAVSQVESQKNKLEEALVSSEKSKKELEEKAKELERFNKLTVDRELKMIELKKKMEELESKKEKE